MTQELVVFLDVVLQYCTFHFGNEEGARIYNYYRNNSIIISTNIEYNKLLKEKETFFLEIRFVLQQIETDVFKHDITVYYKKFPYNTELPKILEYEDFLISLYEIYRLQGEPHFKEWSSSIRVEFSRKILDLLIIQDKGNLLYNHDKWSNNYIKRLEQLNVLLESNSIKSFEIYGKHYRELTKKDFRAFIEQTLNQRDGQHIVDHLWYHLRDDSKEPLPLS